MLPIKADNDITLSLEDMDSILSQGKNITSVTAKSIKELIKEKNVYLNAKGVIILFEMTESYPIIEINTWLDIINENINEDALLIFASRQMQEARDINLTMLCTH